ncbi:ThiF family adenylyltransferase [Streptomyces sp. TRM 70361]|uniref:ThiF family adenylyltransferase n=1 Tax=Streptomyces sp. TRM 70361 TaxID=3116553 RepID=UPI002E7B05EE|nr:ThiF family adenylyltransferase [Streptomyces sp. TRM 70361]MEE1938877.1 ThiF family adenylyltransferase [Streptomyces sp. TRM 70361]
MHPMIKPALRRAWRDRHTVRYGVTPAHAVLLGPLDTATGGFLELFDGTRSLPQLRQAAEGMGLAADTADRLAARLTAAGLLDDATAHRRDAARVDDRLRPDLGSLSVLRPEPGGAVRRLAARAEARVQVRGAGRVGAAVAALLSAAGVGRVEVVDGGCVAPWDTAPGGIAADQCGRRRASAADRAVRRAAPGPRRAGPGPAAPDPGIALVVIAPRDGLAAYAPDQAAAEELVGGGRPHLYAGVVEGTGFVGPLVLPGATACAGCLMLGCADREPAWPLVVAQWRSARSSGVPACDVALSAVVAGATAGCALDFLDGDESWVADSRQLWVLPRLRSGTEPVPPHPECPCGAASVSASVSAPVSAAVSAPASAADSAPGGRPLSAEEARRSTMAP